MTTSEAQPRIRQTLNGEGGALSELGLVVMIALLIFGIGYFLDIPNVQSAAQKLGSAVDFALTEGTGSWFAGYGTMAVDTFRATDENERNRHGTKGRYTEHLEDEHSEHAIFIPRMGIPSNLDPTAGTAVFDYDTVFRTYTNCKEESDEYGCGRGAAKPSSILSGENLTLLRKMFDQNGLDDFRNSVVMYGKVRTFQYLPIIGDPPEIEIFSGARIKTTLSYILIDPAFSLQPESSLYRSYDVVFGTPNMALFGVESVSELPTVRLAPVAALRDASGKTIVYPKPGTAWAYPDPSLASPAPMFYSSTLPTGTTAPFNDTQRFNRYKFLASSCDNMPFFLFKQAAVNMIDRLSQSSAFNSTTLVGLTGYRAKYSTDPDLNERLLVPIYPVHEGSGTNHGFSIHTAPSSYPIPAALHAPMREAFAGWVDPDNWNQTYKTPGLIDPLNRWELCYCRALYGNQPASYILNEDLYGSVFETGDDDLDVIENNMLSHAAQSKRLRDAETLTNWCDDGGAASVKGVSLTKSRSGAGAQGETPRNLVAGLAMRTGYDLSNFAPVEHTPTKNWADKYPQPGTSGETVHQGFRYLPSALKQVCLHMNRVQQGYTSTNTAHRPIESRAVMYYGFGVYSDSALLELFHPPDGVVKDYMHAAVYTNGAADAAVDQEAAKGNPVDRSSIVTLEEALHDCACRDPNQHPVPTKIFLSFLPMSGPDKSQVADANVLIRSFQAQANSQCIGAVLPNNPCGSGESNPIFVFNFDYIEERPPVSFGYKVGPEDEAKGSPQARQDAAFAFQENTLNMITRLLYEYVYQN